MRSMSKLPRERFTPQDEWRRHGIYIVKSILDHKIVDGAYQFLVQFDGVDEPKWQSPVGETGTGIRSTNVFKEYVRAHNLDLRAPVPAGSARSA